MPRIVHVIAEMGAGGAESLTVELVRRATTHGWQSSVASAGGFRETQLVAEGLIAPIRMRQLRRRPHLVAAASLDLRRGLRNFRPDVIVGHNVGASVAGSLARAGLRPRIPILSVFHGVSDEDYGRAARILSRVSDQVVVVADSMSARLRQAGFVGEAPITIRNAVPRPTVVSMQEARSSLGLRGDIPIAMCMARMVPQKRHDLLLAAWARVPEPALLILAGDGPLRPALEAQSRSLGLSDRVQFLGVRDDIPTLLAAADITTLASDWEGLPIAILESMASGRPVVATAVDGVVEALGAGGGILTRAGDVDSLAEGLRRLLGDGQLRIRAADVAMDTITSLYDPEVMMHAYDLLWRQLVDTTGRSL